MNDFMQLGLPQPLLDSLTKMNFTTPTPIQAQAIPMALKGRDVLGTAQTGTGKTGAFGIPLIAKLMNDENAMAIVMTPTRELAGQVMQALRQMIDPSTRIRIALLIGGEPMGKQMQQIKAGPRLIVGTPGRINDHLNRRSLNLKNANFLVLDETDRMLDMGFGVQIDKILTYMPGERQTMLFSATLPSQIAKISARYQNNPERVAVGSTTAPSAKITQEVINTSTHEKYGALTEQLNKREGSIIIFVKTKHGADRLARKLDNDDHSAEAIHGDLRQNQRDRVIRDFRASKHRILVATDVAARGLDVPQVRHVINYDLPQCPEDYIHRIGRTARAGAEGAAVCLLTSEDGAKWRAITRLIDPSAKHEPERGENNNRRPGHAKQRFGGHRKGPKSSFRNKYEGKREFGRDDNRSDNRDVAAAPSGEKRSYGPRQDRSFRPKYEGKFEGKRDFKRDDNRDDNRGNRDNASAPAGEKRPFQKREFRDNKSFRPKFEGKRDFKRDDNRDDNRGNRDFKPRERADNFGNREGTHEQRAYDPRPAHKRHPSDSYQPRRDFDGKKKFGGKKPWQKNESGDGQKRDFKPRDRSENRGGDKPQGGFDAPRRKPFDQAA